MKRIAWLIASAISLTGCYEKTPSAPEAVELAKQEVSMALCGDKSASCIATANGKANIGERLNDNTNKIVVTFETIKANTPKLNQHSTVDFIGGGIVAYDFDAKSGKTHVKEISLWSDDGSHSISLCGHHYTFCKK